MSLKYHNDDVFRARTAEAYLSRRLDEEARSAFEDHYLTCDECYEELRGTGLLMIGVGQPVVEKTQSDDITVIRFAGAAQLTGTSSELAEMARLVHGSGDTKVLIDLSRVSRIDSAGLGMLMNCYTHAVRNAGVLKLLHPNTQVQQVLSITRIDSVVATFDDEPTALKSFQ
jgi:anti-sigma B factor antagonist